MDGERAYHSFGPTRVNFGPLTYAILIPGLLGFKIFWISFTESRSNIHRSMNLNLLPQYFLDQVSQITEREKFWKYRLGFAAFWRKKTKFWTTKCVERDDQILFKLLFFLSSLNCLKIERDPVNMIHCWLNENKPALFNAFLSLIEKQSSTLSLL